MHNFRIKYLVGFFIFTLLFLFSLKFNMVFAQTSSKKIEIDLSNQKLYAFENNNKIFDFSISSGTLYTPTPIGTFYVWIKLKSTRMTGGDLKNGTYYNLPNVPYVMYLYNESIPKPLGYGIHGAYWHNNFGHPMSHGCINMKIQDAEKIYSWIGNENDFKKAPIYIYGNTPSF